MTNFDEGYSATWEVCMVDEDTWADSGKVEKVREVSVSRDGTDDVPLLETGSIRFAGTDFSWAWLRIYMIAEQKGTERHPIATLLFEATSRRHDHDTSETVATGRSVLQPAADRKLMWGAFAAKGTDGAKRAASLVSECTPAPVKLDGSFILSDNVVFDLGSSYLEAAWQLLDAGNFCMQIDGDGTIHVCPMPEEPSLELSKANAGLLIPGIDDELSIADVPNRVVAIDGSHRAVAVNEDPESPTSRQSRGRWVDLVEESPTLVDGESLEMYANRRLAEESDVRRTYSYEREFAPGVTVYSMVRATLASNGIEGDLHVIRQDLECGHGIKVKETVS